MRSTRNRCRAAACARQSGVTLIELMAVLAIMAILATVAQASYREYIARAKRTEGKSALMQLLQQEERYYSLHNTYVAFSSTSTDEEEKKFKWYSGENASASAYEIVAEACPDESIRNCVQLTAIPGTAKVDGNFKDSYCGKLVASSIGTRKADNEDCWR